MTAIHKCLYAVEEGIHLLLQTLNSIPLPLTVLASALILICVFSLLNCHVLGKAMSALLLVPATVLVLFVAIWSHSTNSSPFPSLEDLWPIAEAKPSILKPFLTALGLATFATIALHGGGKLMTALVFRRPRKRPPVRLSEKPPFREFSDPEIQELHRIIDAHFDLALKRIDSVHQDHFRDIKRIAGRHWRNLFRDTPKELARVPVGIWNVTARKLQKKPPIKIETNKEKEIKEAVVFELLQLPELDQKIEQYFGPFQMEVESAIVDELRRCPIEMRKEIELQLDYELKRLVIASDGLREVAAATLLGGIVQAWGVEYQGGAFAAGNGVAMSIYTSQLSAWGKFNLWLSSTSVGSFLGVQGVPMWVSVAGGVGGLLVAALLVPLIGPLCELTINSWTGKRTLRIAVKSTRAAFLGEDPDDEDAGKVRKALRRIFGDGSGAVVILSKLKEHYDASVRTWKMVSTLSSEYAPTA